MNQKTRVSYQEKDKVFIITLNRPNQHNALDQQGIHELANAFKEFERSNTRVAILETSGKHFCSGIDLNDLPDASIALPGIGINLTKPWIACVSGAAAGFGLALVTQSDLCIASNDSFFIYPEAKVGFSGGLISGLTLRIPTKIANEMIYLGEAIKADRAKEVGLINQIVQPGEEKKKAMELAEKITQRAPLVIKALKKLITETIPLSPAEQSGRTKRYLNPVENSQDMVEGLKAFKDKKSPKFFGK